VAVSEKSPVATDTTLGELHRSGGDNFQTHPTMKTPAEYEQEIADLKRLIEKLKAQTVKALEAYVGEMRKVEELSK